VDYVASGGEDWTLRVWKFDETCQAYILRAVLTHPALTAPEDQSVPMDGHARLSGIVPWSRKVELLKSGVTAVACVGSKRTPLQVNVKVTIEEDLDFIEISLGYYDMVVDHERLEAMLGKVATVTKLGGDNDDFVDLELEDGTKETLPGECVRVDETPHRDGPFLSATSDGEVCVLCLHSEPHVRRFQDSHVGTVNDLCVIPTGLDQLDFIVVTAGDDGISRLFILECEELQLWALGEQAPKDASEKDRIVLRLVDASICCDMPENGGRPLRLEHKREDGTGLLPVLECRHVDEGDFADDGVSFATLANDGVRLWSLKGELLVKLLISGDFLYLRNGGEERRYRTEVESYTLLSLARKDTGTLLFVGGQGTRTLIRNETEQGAMNADEQTKDSVLAVWFLEDGMVTPPRNLDKSERVRRWNTDKMHWKQENRTIKPVAVYPCAGKLLDVDQSGLSTDFACEVRDDLTIIKFSLSAVKPEFLALDPASPAQTLIMPGKERIELELNLGANVTDMRVAEDPGCGGNDVAGAALIVGLEDGTVQMWDIEGTTAGQKYAEMRSMGLSEIFVPPLLLLVGSVQVISFAFGPTIPWKEEVHRPATMVRRYAVLNFTYELNIEREQIFWITISSVLGVMLFFMVVASTGFGFLDTTDGLIRRVQNGDPFKAEMRTNTHCAPYHLVLKILKGFRGLVTFTIEMISTILVVPMVNWTVQAFDCVPRDPDDKGVCFLMQIPCKVATAPTIQCFETVHARLAIVLLLVVPLYIYMLIPYAACSGDASYVSRAVRFDYDIWNTATNTWIYAAKRKATVLNESFFHRNPTFAFQANITELVVKIMVPVIATMSTETPVPQMAMITCVGFSSWLISYCQIDQDGHGWFLEPIWDIMNRAVKFLTGCTMACGLLTSCLKYYESPLNDWLPILLIAASFLGVFVYIVWRWNTTPLRPQRWNIFKSEQEDLDNTIIARGYMGNEKSSTYRRLGN
jgi:WD40 repeat protein